MKIVIILIISILSIVGCDNNADKKVKTNKKTTTQSNKLSGVVLEKFDVDKYTYVKIKNSANEELWIAGNKNADVKVGSVVNPNSGMLMRDFVSKTLKRTFKEIYFVTSLTGKKGSFHGGGSYHGNNTKPKGPANYHGGSKHSKANTGAFDLSKVTKVEKVEGGYSIEEIHQKKNDLNGKVIKVKGIVVKFAPEIMKRNWVHIQDGSGKTENNDLTITTKEKVKMGDTVTFEGKLAVDKDFGYGYKYSVIIEESSIK